MGLDAISDNLRGCVLTIGNFDGVHLGHQKIVQTARSLAQSAGAAVVAVTFEPPPELAFHPDSPPRRITPNNRKCELLRQAGADCVVFAAATPELLGVPAKEFVSDFIVKRFAATHVVEGFDFHFGAKRGGNVSLLGLLGLHFGFAAHVVEAVTLDFPQGQLRISSTLIRQFISEGSVEDAARCMGRPFELAGPVIAGEGKGRLIDFPTANLAHGEQIVPADGVYAGRATIDGRTYPAAISVGHKLTLGPTTHLFIEAFLIDAHGDFYNRQMTLAFLAHLRPQEKFADMAALQAQIARDVQKTREVCS